MSIGSPQANDDLPDLAHSPIQGTGHGLDAPHRFTVFNGYFY